MVAGATERLDRKLRTGKKAVKVSCKKMRMKRRRMRKRCHLRRSRRQLRTERGYILLNSKV